MPVTNKIYSFTISQGEKLVKFGQIWAKIVKNWPKSENPSVGNSNDPFASPVAICGYRWLHEYTFRPVLGYFGSFIVRKWSNLGQIWVKLGENRNLPRFGHPESAGVS